MPSYSVPISQRVANSGYWLLAPTSVSIPSTVKDHWLLATRPSPQHPLPSPQQVGDSLVIETLGIFRFVSIPSRRVGDDEDSSVRNSRKGVSIPSRRVGDLVAIRDTLAEAVVSIPSRRVGDEIYWGQYRWWH